MEQYDFRWYKFALVRCQQVDSFIQDELFCQYESNKIIKILWKIEVCNLF